MAWKSVDYSEIRNQMQPGDLIAFGGKTVFSELIKFTTKSVVSHIGIILQSKLIFGEEAQPGKINHIIESTTINDFSGVSINRFSERLNNFVGEVWWLPLNQETRNKLDLKSYYDFLMHQDQKPYDLPQAITSALDAMDQTPVLGKLTHNQKDFTKFFYSELVAAGLEKGGAINNLNASEVTPADLCSFSIFQDTQYQLKGDSSVINGYNQVKPDGWGE